MRTSSLLLLAVSLLPHLLAAPAGTLRVSGANTAGQLGNGESAYSAEFRKIATGVTAVSVGLYHTLYTDDSANLWGLGFNPYGQLGEHPLEAHEQPVRVAKGVTKFTAGYIWSFYWTGTEALYALGGSPAGIWGDSWANPSPKGRPVKLASNVKKAVSEWISAVYLLQDGTLYGRGLRFEDWDPEVNDPTHEYAKLHEGVVDVALLAYQPVILQEDGSLSRITQNSVEFIATNVTAVEGNGRFIMFTNEFGELFVYGDEISPAMGLGGGSASSHPQFLASGVTSFHIGHTQSSAFFIDETGKLWGMGKNDRGQLGLGDFLDRDTPTLIATGVRAVSASDSHTTVLLEDGLLLATGDSSYGKLGPWTKPAKTPAIVDTNIIAVELGLNQLHYIDENNTLYATGRNESGQLGLGHFVHVSQPQQVATEVIAVSAGNSHSLYLTSTGQMYGSGSNDYKQLGDIGEMTADSTLIASGVAIIEAGNHSTFYVTDDGDLYGLGHAYEFKASADYGDTVLEPELIATDVVDLSASTGLCYVTESGELWATALIDTEVEQATHGQRYMAYIKADGTLWEVNPRRGGEDGMPKLIDSNVARIEADAGGDRLLYQKSDGALWYRSPSNFSFEHFSREAVQERGAQFQVHAATEIFDFAVGGDNAAYVTAPPPIPEVTELSADQEAVEAGDPVTLTVESIGAFEAYQWYEGELGDTSNPIENSNHREVSVHPLVSSSFWVEAKNEIGAGSSESAVTVSIANPDFGAWAAEKGLFGRHGKQSEDPDGDGASNLEEYALDTDPLAVDKPYFEVKFLPQLGRVSATYGVNPNASVRRRYLWRRSSSSSEGPQAWWDEVTQSTGWIRSADVQLLESPKQVSLTVPLDSIELPFLFRLGFESSELD